MKHISIRLSSQHATLIEGTSESPFEVIRAALYLYFKVEPDSMPLVRETIEEVFKEHLRLYHQPVPKAVPNFVHNAQTEHFTSTNWAQPGHKEAQSASEGSAPKDCQDKRAVDHWGTNPI
jgi:hypothetical protein